MRSLNLDLNVLDLAFLAHLNGFQKAENFYLSMAGLPPLILKSSFAWKLVFRGAEQRLVKNAVLSLVGDNYTINPQYRPLLWPLLSYTCTIQVINNHLNSEVTVETFYWDRKTQFVSRIKYEKKQLKIDGFQPEELVPTILEIVNIPGSNNPRSGNVSLSEDVSISMEMVDNVFGGDVVWTTDMLLSAGLSTEAAACILYFRNNAQRRGVVSFKTNPEGDFFMEDMERCDSAHIFDVSGTEALGFISSPVNDSSYGIMAACTAQSFSEWLNEEIKTLCFTE